MKIELVTANIPQKVVKKYANKPPGGILSFSVRKIVVTSCINVDKEALFQLNTLWQWLNSTHYLIDAITNILYRINLRKSRAKHRHILIIIIICWLLWIDLCGGWSYVEPWWCYTSISVIDKNQRDVGWYRIGSIFIEMEELGRSG